MEENGERTKETGLREQGEEGNDREQMCESTLVDTEERRT